MAIFTPGPIVSDIRGSIGGSTFSIGPSGNTVRLRRGPVNTTSSARGLAHGRLSSLAKRYQQLSETVRTSWSSFASANPITNRFGNPQVLSGIAMYTYLNGPLHSLHLAINDAPPPNLFVSYMSEFIIAAYPGDSGEILVQMTVPELTSDETVQLFLSGPQGNARRRPSNGYFLIPSSALPVNAPFDVTPYWVKRFGKLPTLGGPAIIGKANVINKIHGQRSPKLSAVTQFITIPSTIKTAMLYQYFRTGIAFTDVYIGFYNSDNGTTAFSWDPTSAGIMQANQDMVFGYLVVSLQTPGVDQTLKFTLAVNGVDTAMTFLVGPGVTDASDILTRVVIAPGDYWAIHITATGADAWQGVRIGIVGEPTDF